MIFPYTLLGVLWYLTRKGELIRETKVQVFGSTYV